MQRLCISAFCVVAAHSIGWAQPAPITPDVISDSHESPQVHFSHWSAVIQKDDRYEFEYAVCNFDKTNSLIYKWTGPNLTVGDGGRLPTGKCHTLRREAPTAEIDWNASISFTQAKLNHVAAAHVPKITIGSLTTYLPRFLSNQVRAFYGPENAQPRLATLIVNQARGDGTLRHIISWQPPSVTVAIALTAFGGAAAEYVTNEMKARGYDVEIKSLKDSLAEGSQSAIPGDRLTQQVALITKNEKSPVTLDAVVKLEKQTRNVISSYVTLIDRDSKRLIVDFPISTFAP